MIRFTMHHVGYVSEASQVIAQHHSTARMENVGLRPLKK